jgi:hypothetical protein
MAPNRETLVDSYSKSGNKAHKPRRLSMENLQRTISDISLEPSKEASGHEKLFIIIINKCVVFLIT